MIDILLAANPVPATDRFEPKYDAEETDNPFLRKEESKTVTDPPILASQVQ